MLRLTFLLKVFCFAQKRSRERDCVRLRLRAAHANDETQNVSRDLNYISAARYLVYLASQDRPKTFSNSIVHSSLAHTMRANVVMAFWTPRACMCTYIQCVLDPGPLLDRVSRERAHRKSAENCGVVAIQSTVSTDFCVPSLLPGSRGGTQALPDLFSLHASGKT